jgi:hypothetical protein
MACPPKALPDIDPGAGEGFEDCLDPTLRIWARTWDSCRSYSQAAC